MHEFSLACEVIRIAREELQESGCGVESLVAIRLVVGQLANVECESLRFMLDVVAQREGCPGLDVGIRSEPPTISCPRCGQVEVRPFEFACPACGSLGELLTGDALRIEALEFERSEAGAAVERERRGSGAAVLSHV